MADKKKKKPIIIILIIAAIIVVGVIISSGGSSDSDSSKTTTSSAINAENQEQGNSNNDTKAEEAEQAEGTIGDYACTIKTAKICKDWEGKDAVKITYLFTNNDDDAQSFDIALTDEVYQDGIQLESSFVDSDEDDWGIDVKIKTGMSKEVSKVYLLRDKTTPLEIEISELISFSDDKLTYTVNLE